MLIRDVRPWGGPAADVVLADGVIAELRVRDPLAPAAEVRRMHAARSRRFDRLHQARRLR